MKSPDDTVVYSLELGGTHTRAGVYRDGSLRQTASVVTPQATGTGDDPTAVTAMLSRLVRESFESEHPADAIAVSVTGMLRISDEPGARSYGPLRDHELHLSSPNIGGLKNVAFLKLLESLGWNVPIHVEHDVNAALRAAVTHPTALGINMGTGIGAAVKRSNKIQHFGDYWSGYEIGHGFRWQLPDDLVRKCTCGTLGCLESVIGARALFGRYGVRPEKATKEMYQQMRTDVVTYLAPAISDTAAGFGLDTVVLFGKSAIGFSDDFDFAGALQQRISDVRPHHHVPVIAIVDLPEIAGLLGATLALLDNDVLARE